LELEGSSSLAVALCVVVNASIGDK